MIGSLILFNLLSFSEPGFEIDSFNASLPQQELWHQIINSYEGPALQSGIGRLPIWESYARWICLPRYKVVIESSLLNYWKWVKNPGIVTYIGGRVVRFEPGAEMAANDILTKEQWNLILSDSKEVCIYAAFLQNIDENEDLWIITRLKSSQGEWREERDLVSWRE